MEDLFPEKRKPMKKLEDGFDVESIQPILAQVMQFLMTKALHENKKQDKYNPTQLANVSFYINYNDITKETRLIFDKHPSRWQVNDMYFEMRNIEADIMMEKQASEDISDNPFVY